MGVSLGLRIVVVLLCIAFFLFTVFQVKSQKLLVKYSLLWFGLSFVILIVAVFPDPIFRLAELLGFDIASNFVFAIGMFFLLMVCLIQTRAISKQIMKSKRTVQRLALLEDRVNTSNGRLSMASLDVTEEH